MDNIANIMKALNIPIDPILGGLPSVDASTVKNRYRDVAALAAKGAIAISRYARPELVMMPAASGGVNITKIGRLKIAILRVDLHRRSGNKNLLPAGWFFFPP